MKKIWILSAVTIAFLMAEGDSLESLLESKKKKVKQRKVSKICLKFH